MADDRDARLESVSFYLSEEVGDAEGARLVDDARARIAELQEAIASAVPEMRSIANRVGAHSLTTEAGALRLLASGLDEARAGQERKGAGDV